MGHTEIAVKDLPEVFNQTAIQLAFGTPAIIEKDYWLVKILQILYEDSNFYKHHLFKGGTSLSKCYQCIERFSEDLDITIDRSLIGFNESDQEVAEFGSKRRKRYFDELSNKTNRYIVDLSQSLLEKIKDKFPDLGWNIYIDSSDSQRIIIEYPKLLNLDLYPKNAYVAPRIIFEFGCRGDMFPHNNRKIQTYIEQAFPNIGESNPIEINTLHAERTFWEKITLLHMLAHQPDDKPLQSHIARHYYDIHMLYQNTIGKNAIKDIALLQTVAFHKSVFFRSKQASYETAKPGSLLLTLSDVKLKYIREDYESMHEMFFSEIVPFDTILTTIELIQNDINE